MHTLPTLPSPPAAQPSQSSLRDARFPFLSPAVTSVPLFVTYGDISPRPGRICPGRGESVPAGGSLSSKGEPLAVHTKFISLPRPLPLGEVDANAVSRQRGLGRSPQRGCFRRKPALQMPLSSTTLPVKMQCRTARRLPGIALIKIILPLFMRKANAERILNRFTGRRGSGCTPPWKRNGRGCARPSDGWWKGLWARTVPPTGSGGWQCRAAPASPAG